VCSSQGSPDGRTPSPSSPEKNITEIKIEAAKPKKSPAPLFHAASKHVRLEFYRAYCEFPGRLRAECRKPGRGRALTGSRAS